MAPLARGQVPANVPAAGAGTMGQDGRDLAREEYAQGKVAFAAGDYLRAAGLFMSAFGHLPHHDSLWNAARSYELSGEKARAANLYGRYLAIAPADARDRDRATAARRELSASLGRIDVHGPATEVRIDDTRTQESEVFVDPGEHVIRGRVDGADVQRVVSVQAGAVVSVVLERQASAPSAGGASAPMPAATSSGLASAPVSDVTPTKRDTKPFSPVYFYVGAGLTAVALGLTIASGVDTLEAKSSYENTGSPSVSEGLYKQDRTNVLFWSTVGLGAVTAAVGIFLVDFRRGSSSARVGFGPGTAWAGGVF
jgi:tetratricopeptide (TPR) repeat protein